MVLLQELFGGCLEKQRPQRRMQDVANGSGGETQKWNCGEGRMEIEKNRFVAMSGNLWLFCDPEDGQYFDSLTNRDFCF